VKEFKCNKCESIFYTRDDLRTHIFNEHLYRNIDTAFMEKDQNDTSKNEINPSENILKKNLAEILSNEDGASEFSEISNEAMSIFYGETHGIFKSRLERCVLREISFQSPPGWKLVKKGTYQECQNYMTSVCGKKNKC